VISKLLGLKKKIGSKQKMLLPPINGGGGASPLTPHSVREFPPKIEK
jgi:hypothetical protein